MAEKLQEVEMTTNNSTYIMSPDEEKREQIAKDITKELKEKSLTYGEAIDVLRKCERNLYESRLL